MQQKEITVAIQTLGCKLNQAESEMLARRFTGMGYEIANSGCADIVVLNTCSVTHIADRKARQLVRKLRESNPHARLIVTGCYAERAATELQKCGADTVLGNADKLKIPDIVVLADRSFSNVLTDKKNDVSGRVRSFVKIQDGCRNYCSYCIVPLVRSQVNCVEADYVIAEILEREKEGCREVVLTGTEIGSYVSGSADLSGLLERSLRETAIPRIHLSSLQPQHVTDGLLRLWQDNRLVRHFHLALQSGSNTVLRRMRRRYSVNDYSRAVESIRHRMPDAAVTTDVMVGFPGETDAEFEESYLFCQNMQFAAMHIFSYSPRPSTSAASVPGRVNEKTKKERSLRMLELAADSADRFARRFIGQTRVVLWENEVKKGSAVYSGLTDNYLRAYARSGEDLSNTMTEAKLTKLASDMHGTVLKISTKGNHGEIWSEIAK